MTFSFARSTGLPAREEIRALCIEKYSFLALGSQRWAYKSDAISFEFEVKNCYKNIIKETFVTISAQGKQVVRDDRGYKKKLRTADARTPASRREQRD